MTKIVKVGDISTQIRGVSYSKNDAISEKSEGYLPILRANNIQEGIIFQDLVYIPESKITEKQKILSGDVVIAASSGSINLVGKAAAAKENMNASFGAFCKILRPKKNMVNERYFANFFQTQQYRQIISNLAAGANINNLRNEHLDNLEIPLPPLEEQRRIAEILDKADALIQNRKKAIEKLDELLQATFIDMFGDPVTNPKGWIVEKLGKNILHANNGLSRRRKESENVGDIVLRLQDVHYNGIHFEKELNRIRLDDTEKNRYLVDVNDILFIRVNGNPEYVGRSAIFLGYKENIYHNDHLIRLKIKDTYNPLFLVHCLNSDQGKQIISKQIKTSAGQHTISQSGIFALDFYVPNKELQDQWANFAQDIEKQKQKMQEQLEVQETLFKSLQQQAFNGQL